LVNPFVCGPEPRVSIYDFDVFVIIKSLHDEEGVFVVYPGLELH